jgi:hypothetical protein
MMYVVVDHMRCGLVAEGCLKMIIVSRDRSPHRRSHYSPPHPANQGGNHPLDLPPLAAAAAQTSL